MRVVFLAHIGKGNERVQEHGFPTLARQGKGRRLLRRETEGGGIGCLRQPVSGSNCVLIPPEGFMPASPGNGGGGIGRRRRPVLRARTAFSSHRKASCRLRRETEGVGFEPTETCASSVFKTDAIDHSATPPGKPKLTVRLFAGKRTPPRTAQSLIRSPEASTSHRPFSWIK